MNPELNQLQAELQATNEALILITTERDAHAEEIRALKEEISHLKQIGEDAIRAMNETAEAALRQAAMFPESEAEHGAR